MPTKIGMLTVNTVGRDIKPDEEISGAVFLHKQLDDLTNHFRLLKPDDRSRVSRFYAVTITELEKALAYFKTYVVDVEESNAAQNSSQSPAHDAAGS